MLKLINTIINWYYRIESYGLKNTLILYYNLKKDTIFSIKTNNHLFQLRGNTVDFMVYDSIFRKKEYGFSIKNFEPKFIIDAGANIGAASIYLKDKYPNSTIIAIEPEISNFNLLKKNVTEIHNISCINAALWYKKTKLNFTNNLAEKYAFQVQENLKNENEIIVETVTVAEIIQKYNIETIDLFKIDIEGAELELFSDNNLDWISKTKVFCIELHDGLKENTTKTFFKAISKLNYQMLINGENLIIINKNYFQN